MTEVMKVADAKARLSELLNRVEAGEEIVIARGDVPIARVVPETDRPNPQVTLAAMRARRGRYGSTTGGEIREWIDEGRR